MTPPAGEASARAIRQLRARRLAIRFALWVGIPTVFSSFYYGCVVTSQYESKAVVMVQSRAKSSSGSAMRPGPGDTRDAHLMREYIESRAMSSLLARRHHFAEHYQSTDVDRFSRLDPDAGPEEIHEYYSEMVAVTFHSQSRTLHLRVRAFSGEAAQRFATSILTVSEQKLAALFAKARHQPILVTVSEPSLPELPTYPRRAWSVATVFVVALVLMGIFGLLAAAVREHAKF